MAGRVEYLEGLRGIAAFTVFLGHFFPLYIRVALLMSFAYILRDFSVCIFFVLSGYVLTFAFFSTADQEKLVSSAVRRYIRLLIPILFLLVVTYVLVYPGPGNLCDLSALPAMISQGFWGVFLQGQSAYVPNVQDYTGVLWTITIEFIGSFIVFSFAALFGQLRNRWVFYLVALVLFLNTYYLAFILGMILADLSANKSRYASGIKNPWILAAAVVIVSILGIYPLDLTGIGISSGISALTNVVTTTGPFEDTILFQYGGNISVENFIHIIAAFGLLMVLLNSEWLKSALSHYIPVFLGKISFSLYLIHMIVIFTFSSFIMAVLFEGPVNVLNGTIILIITIPVLLGVSYLMYRYVDQPGIILAKKMYDRFFNKRSSA
jgi:peptidoglycan/LPS O-acetylase OafA/YrhL